MKKKTCRFPIEDYEFILDHAPDSEPVVPFVCVVDKFLEAFPNFDIKNISLKKGIIGKNCFHHNYVIEEENNTIQLFNTKKHYTASKETKEKPHQWSVEKSKKELQSPAYEKLFHGKKLQSIKNFTYLDDLTVQGNLYSSKKLGWNRYDWYLDPALADGILQMGCLLGLDKKNLPSLPVKIDKVCFYNKNNSELCWFELKLEKLNKLGYVFSAVCFDEKNNPLFRLQKVQAFFRVNA